MYVNYVDLKAILRYKNTWDKNSINTLALTKLQTETEFDESSIKVTLLKKSPSSTYRLIIILTFCLRKYKLTQCKFIKKL